MASRPCQQAASFGSGPMPQDDRDVEPRIDARAEPADAVRRPLCFGGQQRAGSGFGLVSTERTLILPGDVRYEVDLAKLQPEDVRWDAATQTLARALARYRDRRARSRSRRGARIWRGRGARDADRRRRRSSTRPIAGARRRRLAQAGAGRGPDAACPRGGAPGDRAQLRHAAQGRRDSTRRRSWRDFAAEEGADDPSYLDTSTPYNEAIAGCARKAAPRKDADDRSDRRV